MRHQTTLLLVAVLLNLTSDVLAVSRQPNVLFIFDDQHRKDAVSCYGGTNIQTPNIDRLAREGIRFENCLSTTPICTPYRGMLVTGKYPTHTGLVLNFVNPRRGEQGIADVFNRAGYRTGFIGKWHLTSSVITHHSLLEPKAHPNSPTLKEPEFVPPDRKRLGFQYWAAFNFHMSYRQGFYYRDTPERQQYPGYEAEWMANDAIDFLESHEESEQPFFLMVAPHYPHPLWRGETDVPAEALAEIRQDIKLRPNSKQTLPFEVVSFGGNSSLLTLDQVRTYYAMCANVDHHLGRVLECLDRTGQAENTIVVFTTDHGEQLGSHGRKSKMLPFEESINIPLVMRWPKKIAAGTVTDVLQTPMDHLPTLCGLAGIEIPEGLDGIDLSQEVLQTGEVDRESVLISHYVSSPNYCQAKFSELQWRGVRSKTHTYVKNINGVELLYDNIADPYQRNSLAMDFEHRPLLAALRSRLESLLAEAHDELVPGTHYADWFDETRTVIRTGAGEL